MKRLFGSIAAGAVFLAACNNAVPPSLESTTTTTAGAPPTSVTTTSVTLPPPDLSEPATVEAVIDGDTIRVITGGVEADVRLLGVNAPEVEECYGDQARTELTDLLGDFEIVMLPGAEDTDPFGRLLRYVYVDGPDDTTFVNEQLVVAGAAVALQNGHEFQDEFKALEDRAYASGRGMWGTFVCGHPESGVAPDRPQLRVDGVSFDPPGPDGDALDAEWVELVNESYTSVDLGGWVIRDESSSNRLEIPRGTSLAPGNTIRIVTGCGTSGPSAVFWCADSPVWNNDGDTVIVQDHLGNVVERYVYGGDRP